MTGTDIPEAVELRDIAPAEVARARALHSRFTGQDVPTGVFREWYEGAPELFVGAFEAGEMVGVVTGHRREETAELAGLGVLPDRRRTGIGSALVAAFEAAAASIGVEGVSVASAGGYVDRFYAAQGYEPWTVLVRTPEDAETGSPDADYDIVAERVEDGVRKRYVDAEGADLGFADEVGEAFGDDEAVFVMRKPLDG